jgi:hypothetical protein
MAPISTKSEMYSFEISTSVTAGGMTIDAVDLRWQL